MSYHLYESVKKDLFAQYNEEITALVEGRKQTAELIASEWGSNDDEIIPSHLRVSYSRQQLLCLRAARGTAARPPCALLAATSLSTEGSHEKSSAAAKAKERQALANALLKAETDEAVRRLNSQDPLRGHMQRLQEESIAQLRQSVLEQARYKAAKNSLHVGQAEERCTVASSSGTDRFVSTGTQALLDSAGTTSTHPSISDALRVVEEGGVHGDDFTRQRMKLLEEMELQLKRDKVTRQAAMM